MGPRQESDLATDRPDLVEGAAVEAFLLVEDGRPGDFLGQDAEDTLDPGGLLFGLVLGQGFDRLGSDGVDRVLLLELAPDVHRLGQFGLPLVPNLTFEVLGPGVGCGLEGFLDDTALGDDLQLQGDQPLDFGMSQLKGVDDDRFRQPVGAALDHGDGVFRAGNHQVEVGDLAVLVGREEDELAVDPADPNRRKRCIEGNRVGDHQCDRGAVHRQDVGIVVVVRRDHPADHLGLDEVAVGKQGPESAVDDAAGQSFLLRGTAFAFEEPAGDASAGVGILAIVDGQGQEVRPAAGLVGAAGGDEHHRVVETYDHRTGGLFGDLAQFERKGLATESERFSCNCHVFSVLLSTAAGGLPAGPLRRGLRPSGPAHPVVSREGRVVPPASGIG